MSFSKRRSPRPRCSPSVAQCPALPLFMLMAFLTAAAAEEPAASTAERAVASGDLSAPSAQAATANAAPTATQTVASPPAAPQAGAGEAPLTAEEALIVDMMADLFRGKDGQAGKGPPAEGADSAAERSGSADLSALAQEDPNLALRRYSESERRTRLNAFASAFYRVLPQRNLELLKMLCAHPFHFEGRRVETEQAFEAEWARIFANLRLGAVPMKRMQVFSAEEMVRHFGERPAKLAGWPVTEASYFSVAEFGAQVVIVLWRQSGDLFVAEAIHG